MTALSGRRNEFTPSETILRASISRPESVSSKIAKRGESTAIVRARVLAARERQQQRAGKTNARLSQSEAERDCALTPRDSNLLERAMHTLQLSARAAHRILRVARTIADIEGVEHIASAHLSEAIGYRQLDRGVVRNAA